GPDRRFRAGAAVFRHRRESPLGKGAPGAARTGARRARQGGRLVRGRPQPRRGGEDHGRGEQAQAGRGRKILRLLPQWKILRADRPGLAQADGRAGRRAGQPGRHRQDAGRTADPARRDADGRLTMAATASETERTAAPPRTAGRDLLGALRRNHLAGFLSIVVGLALWEVLSRFVVANPLFLAAPSQILAAIFSLGETGELWRHIGISGLEFVIGYLIAAVLGIALGLAMA